MHPLPTGTSLLCVVSPKKQIHLLKVRGKLRSLALDWLRTSTRKRLGLLMWVVDWIWNQLRNRPLTTLIKVRRLIYYG